MKKNLPKIKVPSIKKKEAPSGRITSDTIAEHRQHVLSEGRRFKYPVQYVKHRLVINTVIIAVVSLILLSTFFWWFSYKNQDSGDITYRITKVLSLPVAKVDGEPVKFSDYLMRYRSSINYLIERDQINLSTDEGRIQAEAIKRRELDGVIADTYAAKIAKQENLEITDEELEGFIIQERDSVGGGVSESTYNNAIATYYGWSPKEYREVMRSKLLLRKVSLEIDTSAREASESANKAIKAGQDLKAVADSLNAEKDGTAVYSIPMWVPKDNYDGGLAAAASKLDVGEVSGPISNNKGTGYYFVKLVESNETQVKYELLQITLSEFSKRLEQIKARDGGVKEYIEIKSEGEGR